VARDQKPQADPKRIDYVSGKLLAKLRKAERDFCMPLAGRRVVVGVSGGWDSLALLALLVRYKHIAAEKPVLFAAYAAFRGPRPAPPPLELLSFVERLPAVPGLCGLRLSGGPAQAVPFLSVGLKKEAANCGRCRLIRRELLLKTARALGAEVLALGHHAEDFGETLLLNLIYSATCEGMAPHLRYFNRYSVVRPLVYLTKKEIRTLGKLLGFPPPPPPCPLAGEVRRNSVRAMVEALARRNRHVVTNLMSASLKSLGLRHAKTPPSFPLLGSPGQNKSPQV